jgi:two-component system cell cycle response regulator
MDTHLKVLVVDGSRVSRRIIARALATEIQAETMEITAVGTAAEALALLATSRFDLITSALLLPDMYGIELCRQLRSSHAHRFTPFILVTAEPHERLMKQGYSAGVTDYYDKTRGFKDFVGFIRSFTARYSRLQGKVLYLEDSYTEAKMAKAMMEHHGLEVVCAASAEQALALLDESFDLVVADFFLQEEMSGGDFLHAIRCGKRLAREQLPVLVITGGEGASMQAEVFHAGANDFVTKPVVEEVLISRIRSLLLIKQQFTQLTRQSEEMRRMANLDGLTGVYNKRYLLDQAEAIVANPRHQPLWVALLDLDHFKSINDRYGHLTGDRVLAGVASLMKYYFRLHDVIARIGGEEFVALLLRRTRQECLSEIEELRRRIEALCPAGFPVTASIGLSTNLGRPEVGFDQLSFEADQAMYLAKQSGRNQVRQWDEIGAAEPPAAPVLTLT